MSVNNDALIKFEMEALKADIITVYNASGKRTSGEFEKGLELSYGPNAAILSGYVYLAGRESNHQLQIEAWLKAKGITPLDSKMKISTLAFLIARKMVKKELINKII
jgi:hypothetical protein